MGDRVRELYDLGIELELFGKHQTPPDLHLGWNSLALLYR